MEYKIDETFYLGRKKFKVVTGNCEECYFGNKAFEFCEDLKEYIGSCNFNERKDRKCVCFKLVEE